MTPAATIAALDRQLAAHGQPVTLRRVVVVNGVATNYDLACPAFVRDYKPSEIMGAVVQGDRMVSLSPTNVTVAAWLGPLPVKVGENPDRRVPMKGDKLVIAGRVTNIEAGNGVYIGGTLVRINLQVRG